MTKLFILKAFKKPAKPAKAAEPELVNPEDHVDYLADELAPLMAKPAGDKPAQKAEEPAPAPEPKGQEKTPDAGDTQAGGLSKKEIADKFHKDLKAELGQDGEAPPQVDLSHPNFVGLLSLLKEYKGGGQFGAHNVAEGDDVAFAAGEFKGSGKVAAVGKHGVTVQDASSREHRVHWHEVTGHKPAAKKGSDAQAR